MAHGPGEQEKMGKNRTVKFGKASKDHASLIAEMEKAGPGASIVLRQGGFAVKYPAPAPSKKALDTMTCPTCGEWTLGPIGSMEGKIVIFVCGNEHERNVAIKEAR